MGVTEDVDMGEADVIGALPPGADREKFLAITRFADKQSERIQELEGRLREEVAIRWILIGLLVILIGAGTFHLSMVVP